MAEHLFNPSAKVYVVLSASDIRFEKSVEILGGDRYCKHFSAWKQCLTQLYAQITGKDSPREVETGCFQIRRTYTASA